MDNIKLNGYFIDIGKSSYNTWGKVNNDWRDLSFYLDIGKKVYLNDNSLVDVNMYEAKEPDEDYKPIGERMGDIGKKFNSIVFSKFSMGKGVYYDNGNLITMNSKGLLLPGKMGISIDDDDEKSKALKETSQLFFKDMLNIKSTLNQANSIAIGEIHGSTDYFGIPNDTLSIFQEDPIKFLSTYCKDSNEDYQVFKKFILKMHQIFNILTWSIDGVATTCPALILLIAKAYKDINLQSNNQNIEYFLTLECDLIGLNPSLLYNWFNNCDSIFKQNQFQKPTSIIFLAMAFNQELYDTSSLNNTLINDIVSCPFSTLSLSSKGSSLDFCKSIFTDSLDTIKKKSIISLNINNIEISNPINMGKQTPKIVDEQFVSDVSNLSLSNNIQGILLWSDRCECLADRSLPPSKISFDNSISNYYSNENQMKIKNYLNQ